MAKESRQALGAALAPLIIHCYPAACPLLREPEDHATLAVSWILQYATTEIQNPIFN